MHLLSLIFILFLFNGFNLVSIGKPHVIFFLSRWHLKDTEFFQCRFKLNELNDWLVLLLFLRSNLCQTLFHQLKTICGEILRCLKKKMKTKQHFHQNWCQINTKKFEKQNRTSFDAMNVFCASKFTLRLSNDARLSMLCSFSCVFFCRN